MPTFEEGFATAEIAADSVLKALNEAASIARQLRKASVILSYTDTTVSVSPAAKAFM